MCQVITKDCLEPQIKGGKEMKLWLCTECWHEIVSDDREPRSIIWSDGHICHFKSPQDIDTSRITPLEELITGLEEFGVDLSDGDFPELDIRLAYDEEVKMITRYALQAKEPRVILSPFRNAGSQFISEFEVLDLFKENNPGQINWHGQNTSQWVYAGCILYDRVDNRVSRHH